MTPASRNGSLLPGRSARRALVFTLAAISCSSSSQDLTAIDLATGETQTFSGAAEIPPGWAACADTECTAIPTGVPCQNLGVSVCPLSPVCKLKAVPCGSCGGSASGDLPETTPPASGEAPADSTETCSEPDSGCWACVSAAALDCEDISDEADCTARSQCAWEQPTCSATACVEGQPCPEPPSCPEQGSCRANTLPSCASLESSRCAARPDCSWAPSACATICGGSDCGEENCEPFCQPAVAPQGCPEISPPAPDLCPEGQLVPEYSATCVIGFRCVLPSTCPVVEPPAPDACPDGLLVPRRNSQGCLIGYECQRDDSCAQLKVKYAQAVEDAKACDPAASGQCQLQVPNNLGCGCPTQVNATSTTVFDDLRKAWEQLGCDDENPCPMSPCTESMLPDCTVLSSAGEGRCAS